MTNPIRQSDKGQLHKNWVDRGNLPVPEPISLAKLLIVYPQEIYRSVRVLSRKPIYPQLQFHRKTCEIGLLAATQKEIVVTITKT